MNEEILMRTSKFTDTQIMAILRQAEGVVPVADLCRQHGISSAGFYKWRAKYGGMDASLMAEKKQLEDENRRLKRMFAYLSMQNELLKEALRKNRTAISTTRNGRDRGSATAGQFCTGLSRIRGK